uniref:Tubulin--tyrosine ligase-like protein 5 n=1 Tax=Cyprinus carpio TaxID=7962 RepID=A0A8C1P3J3_CYPCA
MRLVLLRQDLSAKTHSVKSQKLPCVAWSGVSKRIPVLLFCAEAIVSKDVAIRSVGEKYNLAFKIVRTESRLVRGILVNHGFHEVHPNSNDFNLMWTGSHLKPYLLRSLQDFQKVNHFPRSFELTRKDRLYKNIQRMQQTHGFQNFHIVPQTFVLPAEYQEFSSSFSKDKGAWIIKPVASSRGRGIYLVSSPSQIPLDENILVSRYISNPLLIDGFKFDVRLYVLVTSYDPLLIYLYEEGLARFATVKYDHATANIKNQFMHLTNYSVNKKSSDYVSCDDPEVEDYGNKWSMSAMLRYLRQEGKDTTLLMGQIEDLIVKALLSAEIHIATACKMFVPHRCNCFELYGFDVLIDSNLKPWLLEVNLSPSLACDAPLDLKIKASMISDMFSLVGFVCQDPLLRQPRPDRAGIDSRMKNPTQKLQMKVLRRAQEEYDRRGGFVRIFPTPDTWELYSVAFIILFCVVPSALFCSLISWLFVLVPPSCSKVQARMAFSSYLHRVQLRLLAESRANMGPAWTQKEHDQMELVVRFLKRASSNLRQDMCLEEPSRLLCLSDRQRILSHQLGNFIQLYNQETKQMVESLDKIPNEDRCINSNVFQDGHFACSSSESDLEEVLMFYTQKNKSASVFLGTKCDSSRVKRTSDENRESERHFFIFYVPSHQLRMKYDTAHVIKEKSQSGDCAVIEVLPNPPTAAETESRDVASKTHTSAVRNKRALWKSGSDQPSAAALECEHIVLQHCLPPPYVQPPPHPLANSSSCFPYSISSLSLFCFTVSQKPSLSKSRPGSAGLLKETDSLSAQAQSNQLAIVSALRKLVEKQAARQYSTSSHISLLTQHVSHDLHIKYMFTAHHRNTLHFNTYSNRKQYFKL